MLGGSLGARVFSDVVPAALAALPEAMRGRLAVVAAMPGRGSGPRARRLRRRRHHGVDLSPFFPDVAARLAAAHLVIARAGASTVAELAVAGRPAILVPLPGAIDDHQIGQCRGAGRGRRRLGDAAAGVYTCGPYRTVNARC